MKRSPAGGGAIRRPNYVNQGKHGYNGTSAPRTRPVGGLSTIKPEKSYMSVQPGYRYLRWWFTFGCWTKATDVWRPARATALARRKPSGCWSPTVTIPKAETWEFPPFDESSALRYTRKFTGRWTRALVGGRPRPPSKQNGTFDGPLSLVRAHEPPGRLTFGSAPRRRRSLVSRKAGITSFAKRVEVFGIA